MQGHYMQAPSFWLLEKNYASWEKMESFEESVNLSIISKSKSKISIYNTMYVWWLLSDVTLIGLRAISRTHVPLGNFKRRWAYGPAKQTGEGLLEYRYVPAHQLGRANPSAPLSLCLCVYLSISLPLFSLSLLLPLKQVYFLMLTPWASNCKFCALKLNLHHSHWGGLNCAPGLAAES